MARIPNEEIARIKKETDLVALVRSRGVELGKHGTKDWVGRCPFHTEEKSSFIVSPDKGLYHCMGCGAAGNAIQFVEKFDGVSFRHAFELLSEGRPAFSAQATEPLKQATVPRLENPFEDTLEDVALLARVVEFYHERLIKTPDALDYLRGRGLYHEEAIERFGLGFSDRTLGLRLPAKNRLAGEAIRTRLQSLGLIRESGHEHFSGSLVLPIYTAEGAVGEIYGRKITPNLRKGTPLHLYLQGPHEGIWNVEALDAPEVILCEAPFDALTFWVNGFKNVTFIYGTEGFTDELFEALLVRKVRRVRIAYDADEAGNRAAKRDAERLMAHGIEAYRVKFPWGMDANDYARKLTPAPKSLQLVLKAAEWVGGTTNTRPATPPDPEPPPAVPSAAAEARSLSESSHTLAPAPLSLAALLAAEGSKPLGPEEPRLERVGEYHLLRLGQREYRVGGLEKNNSLEVMKVAVRLRHGEDFHLDSFDMARDGERRRFIERAAEETRLEKDLIKRDLGRLLLLLEEVQAARINVALEPAAGPRTPEMSTEERDEALSFLKSPNLVERIAETFEACGLVGENANRLAAYLACTSRKLEKPLAVIIQSTSAAGKSTLMEAVLAMFPEEERVKYSAMTGQSLYYLGETNLKHKILAIVEEEGAEKASYALKLLQSEGELTIASTGKDPQTGRMETQEYHVEGPVMIFLTTTAIDIDEELQNRCLTLSVDESRKQTERIHALQRKARTLEGLRLKKERRRLLTVMRNVQRLLKPVDVVNPWADELTFTTERTRTRRDHEKYLTLIDAIALLHQYQRPREVDQEAGRSEFIRVTLEDIALANRLAPELLGRSLDDLPPQTRGVYEAIKQIVRERCKSAAVEQRHAFFSRRDVRSRLGWSVTQVRIHLDRLRDLEYIAARFGRPGSAFQYELLTDCNEPRDVGHIGLLDVEKLRLRQQPDGKREYLTGGWRTPPRQVRNVQEPVLALNLTA